MDLRHDLRERIGISGHEQHASTGGRCLSSHLGTDTPRATGDQNCLAHERGLHATCPAMLGMKSLAAHRSGRRPARTEAAGRVRAHCDGRETKQPTAAAEGRPARRPQAEHFTLPPSFS
jgi:hypothetical protein